MPRWITRSAELGRRLARAERWILPGACLLCGARVGDGDDDSLVCAPCRARWTRLPEPVCGRCGQPLIPELECRLCAEWPPGLSGVRSAVWLDDSARRAVHLLKYEGWRRMAEPMAEVLRPLLEARDRITLIPVPLSASRERARGYNQSAELARALAARLPVRLVTGVLRRCTETGTQTALTPEARRANLAGAFVAVAAPVNPVLIDDVFTTGATLTEAAAALLAAGAPTVRALTFARAARPLAGAAGSHHHT